MYAKAKPRPHGACPVVSQLEDSESIYEYIIDTHFRKLDYDRLEEICDNNKIDYDAVANELLESRNSNSVLSETDVSSVFRQLKSSQAPFIYDFYRNLLSSYEEFKKSNK